MFPVKRPSHSWNPTHQVTYNRTPVSQVALCCPTCRAVVWLAALPTGLLRKGQQPWPASTALLEEAVLQGMAVLSATRLLLAISVTASEAKSGTELGAQGSRWSMAEG